MIEPGLILDTAAVQAYSRGTNDVGEFLADAADNDLSVLIPATCLAVAYQQASDDEWGYIDILAGLPQVVVAPLTENFCAVLGDWARTLGLDLAHATIEAVTRPVVPLMTSQRDLVTRFLPAQWPIIDV